MNDDRIFTIAYGNDADEATLKRVAEATNAAAYSAVDPDVHLGCDITFDVPGVTLRSQPALCCP